MKTTYLELLKKIDTTIFQNYMIVDDEEIEIEENEIEDCINNSIPVKIEMLVDFSWYEPLDYDPEKVELIRSGWVWDFFSFDEGQELYDLLAKIGIGDEYWKDWLNQSWGSPEYEQIWDGEELFEDDFFDNIEDAKKYRSVWTIRGTIEVELDCFEND